LRLVSSNSDPAPGRGAVREGVVPLTAPFRLHHGGSLASAQLAWRLVGDPSLPVVVAIGGISADRRVSTATGRGGWQTRVGPPRWTRRRDPRHRLPRRAGRFQRSRAGERFSL
jgi:homoserine acetyltransferase